MESKMRAVRKLCIAVIFALVMACISAVVYLFALPKKANAEDEQPSLYIIGDDSIIGMYGAVAVGGDGEKNGYRTLVEKDDRYVYTYSKHSSGWTAAMREAVVNTVEVRLASDWTATETDRVGAYNGELLTEFGVDEYAFYEGSIRVPQNANVILDINGHVLDRAQTTSGAYSSAIYVDEGATLILNDSNPTTEHLTDDGEAKYTYTDVVTTLAEDGTATNEEITVTVKGGVITGGKFEYRGYNGSGNVGVNVYKAGTFIMNGGSIIGNISNYVGGVYVGSGSTFTMNDGSISGNTANTGGGVYVNSGTFTMNGGKISGNTANLGGGIYVNSSTFTMNDGSISGNTANNGGGVYMNSGTFIMNDGSISGNTASSSCGGVYMNSGTFTMNDGSISGNTASNSGGGVRMYGGTFTMNGGNISGNSATFFANGCGGGVYADRGTFTMNNGTISRNHGENGGGGVQVKTGCTFTMNDGIISGNTTGNAGGGVCVDGTFTMNNGIISGNTGGDMHGGDGGGVCVANSGTFTMNDGTIIENTASYSGGGVSVRNSNSTFTMNNGIISDNIASTYYGGGVYVSSGTFTMNDGTISGNTASNGNGGGVYVSSGGSFTMESGEISGNTANVAADTGFEATTGFGGGVFVNKNSIFTMNGGEISRNVVKGRVSGGGVGGGVYVSGGTFMMEGGEISGNTASASGGGVCGGEYLSGGTLTITMNGGKISGNTAAYGGGGVAMSGGTFTMSGGEISGNTVEDSGGGVTVESSTTFTLSGAPKIYGNSKIVDEEVTANDCDLFKVTVGELADGAYVGIYSASIPFTSGYSSNNSAHPSKYFFSNDETKVIGFNGSEATLVDKPVVVPEYALAYGGEQVEIKGNTITLEYKPNSTLGYTVTPAETNAKIKVNGTAAENLNVVKNVGTYNVEFQSTDYVKAYMVVITPKALLKEDLTLPTETEYKYTGEEITLDIDELTYDGDTLEYTVSYENNINAGTATATLVLSGNYSGEITLEYSIVFGDGVYGVTWQYYVGGVWTDTVPNTLGFIPGETLKSDQSGNIRAKLHHNDSGVTKYAYAANVTDYKDGNVTADTLSALNVLFERDGGAEQMLMNVGEYVVSLSANSEDGLDIVGGTPKLSIVQHNVDNDNADMFDIRVSGVSNIVYDGTAKTPKIVIYLDRLLLVEGEDYEVEYSNNVEGGTATATIQFIGNYIGTAMPFNFNIAKAVNAWNSQLNIVRWSYGEFNSDRNILIAATKYLIDGERVHFSIASLAKSADELTDIPVEMIIDELYGECYRVADKDAIAKLNELDAGTYKLVATLNDTSSYDAPESIYIVFEVSKAQNSFTVVPAIRAWQYNSYNAADNAPIASAVFGTVVTVITDKDGNVVHDSANGIDLLGEQNVGEYLLVATVAASENYDELRYEYKFNIAQTQNAWANGELPTIESWVEGEFGNSNIPVADAIFGTARIVITDSNNKVVYDSENGVNKLADLGAGTYYMTASVAATDNYYALEYSRQFKVLETVGLPWWAVLLIVIGALALAALIIFILNRVGVFQILSEKMVVAIRAKADSDATIAAVRAGKYAEAAYVPSVEAAATGEKATLSEKEEKKTMKKAANLEKKALTPEEKAAELEAKAKAMRKKAEAMKAKAKTIIMTPEEKKAMRAAEKAAAKERGRIKSPEEKADLLEKKAEMTEEQAAQLKAKAEVMKNRATEMRERAARKAERENKQKQKDVKEE